MTRYVFIRSHVVRDGTTFAIYPFATFTAAKTAPRWDRRIELGIARWKGDQWYSELVDDDLGVVIEVRRAAVRHR